MTTQILVFQLLMTMITSNDYSRGREGVHIVNGGLDQTHTDSWLQMDVYS